MDGAERRKALTVAGLGLLAFGGVMLLGQKPGAAQPGPSAAPGSSSCSKSAPQVAKLVTGSRFYNWSDLRLLPLNPSDPHDWSHGGGTIELGWLPGHAVTWFEAKYGTADDGRTGWFLRVDRGGDWALPAVDCGVPLPCS